MPSSTLAEPLPARALGGNDYKTLALSALGGALEFYDFIIFVFFATTIGKLFFPPEIPDWVRQLQTFGIFAAGYLARPLGGVVMAHFGDLLGRKKMFTLSILLMAIPTLLMGVLPTYATAGLLAPVLLLVLRLLQGAAVGGEVPGAWVFVAEHVPANRIGYAGGMLTGGLTSGILLGSLVATAVNSHFDAQALLETGWRVPFLLGGVFGLCAMFLRQWLEETPVFIEMKRNKALAAEVPLKAVVRDHRAAVVISMLLTWMLSAAIVTVILLTPTFLQKLYGFDAPTALRANSVATLTLTIGCVIWGAIVDRLGAARAMLIGALSLALCSWLFYTGVRRDPTLLMPLYGLAGFAVGVIGVVPYAMVQLFPPAVRFSGLSFSYNLSYAIFGGLTPMIVTLWLKSDSLAPSHYVVTLALVGAATAFLLPRKPMR
jgi:MFS family permease